MPIEIREIVTEVVVRGGDEPVTGTPAPPTIEAGAIALQREEVVRQAVERVLDLLRREWER
jgi:hypothetical protein